MASPATPRPNTAPHAQVARLVDDTPTPSRTSFNPAIGNQQPLPVSPFAQAQAQDVQMPDQSSKSRMPRRDNSQHSNKSVDSVDVDMDDSDPDPNMDDGGLSDDDSAIADGSRSSKKKKSQRFYCTDYPPCNLSFTRSEHLARHIR